MIEKTQEKQTMLILNIIKKELKHIKENWLLFLVCFFISRQNIIDELFPFSIVVLSTYCHIRGPWISILLVTLGGIISVRFDFDYTVMLTAIYLFFYNFRKEGKKSIILISAYSAAVLFFSKTAILMADGFSLNSLLLNIFETLFVFSAIILTNEGINTFNNIRKGVKKEKVNKLKKKKTEPVHELVKKEDVKNEAAPTSYETRITVGRQSKKGKYLSLVSQEAKDKIREQLLWQNINLKFIEVIPHRNSSILLSVTVKTDKSAEEAEVAIALIVRNVCGLKLRCVDRIIISPNYYVIKYKNIKKVKIRTYTAQAIKDGSSVSGDNYEYAGRGDKYYAVLCDGLGSGEEAYLESNSALDLMSKFLYSDFTEEQILKTLNSVLMIKLGDERYVTFDFAVIDYGAKELRLYKAGAAPSYIIRGRNVDKISGKSLPLGILDNFEYSSFKKEIALGDIVVMVTDGIIDSISLDPKKSLDKYLEFIAHKDPQTIANSILSYALRGQDKIIDDMTVLVTKIG
ncbi:MAG TPA: SpoIIE family protein phosphatase [Tissierellia bacterium]|nr:SpoIIE family protein phosphatase [Tissierellia bacterium]